MASQHQRTFAPVAPFLPERREVGDPGGKVVDMAGDFVGAQATGTSLTAPVCRGDPPAPAPPMLERFEILLVEIAPAGQKQQAAAGMPGGLRPVDPPDGVAVGGEPATFAGGRRDGAADDRRLFRLNLLANSSLLPVVTIW